MLIRVLVAHDISVVHHTFATFAHIKLLVFIHANIRTNVRVELCINSIHFYLDQTVVVNGSVLRSWADMQTTSQVGATSTKHTQDSSFNKQFRLACELHYLISLLQHNLPSLLSTTFPPLSSHTHPTCIHYLINSLLQLPSRQTNPPIFPPS